MNRLNPDLKKSTVLDLLGLLDYWMNRLKPDLKKHTLLELLGLLDE